MVLLVERAGFDVGVVQAVERNPYCSSTHRVHPSSMLPPFQVSYMPIRGAFDGLAAARLRVRPEGESEIGGDFFERAAPGAPVTTTRPIGRPPSRPV